MMAGRHVAEDPGGALTGTVALWRLALRRDRWRIAIWTLAVGIGVYGSVVALAEAFPTPESIRARGALLENPATLMMTGPAFAADDYTFGAMVANELGLYVFLAVGIMAVLQVVRHTRAEEESGRLEMVRALPAGRHASPAAAIITVGLSCVLVGAAVTLALVAAGRDDLAVADCLAFGLATALTGLVFGALAGLTAQVTESTRGASGWAMGGLALAFLVRGIGDVIESTGSWLSWFSPFAWAQQTRLFVDLRWWPLLVAAAVTVGLLAGAGALGRRRDLGAGLLPASRGPATAARGLRTTFGLASRLLLGSTLVWAGGTLFFAVAMGALANSLDGILTENPQLGQWLALSGTDLAGQFAAIILSYVMIAPVVVGVSGTLALRTEESAGRAEQLIVSGRSRPELLTGWTLAVAGQVVLLTVLGGIGVGLGVLAGTGEADRFAEMTLGGIAYVPAVLLVTAVAVALLGLLPRFTVLAWLFVVFIALALFLGEILSWPEWLLDLSPISQTPKLPTEDVVPGPLVVMVVIAIVLMFLGLVGYRRRDVPRV